MIEMFEGLSIEEILRMWKLKDWLSERGMTDDEITECFSYIMNASIKPKLHNIKP